MLIGQIIGMIFVFAGSSRQPAIDVKNRCLKLIVDNKPSFLEPFQIKRNPVSEPEVKAINSLKGDESLQTHSKAGN